MIVGHSPRSARTFRMGYQFGLLIMVAVSLLSMKQIYDYSEFVQRSRQVDLASNQIQQVELRLREAEAQQMGYVYSGEESFIANYNRALKDFERSARGLSVTTAEFSRISRAQLVRLAKQKFAFMNETMSARASGNVTGARRRLASAEGISLAKGVEGELLKMDQILSSELKLQDQDLRSSARFILATIFFGTLLAVGLLIFNRKASLREAEDFRRLSQILADGQAELVRLNEEAKVSSRAKSDFLANISHEVRTPLNGISGLSQILLQSGVSNEQRQLVQGIQKSSQALLDIINPVLDISKIEHEGLTLDLEEGVSLSHLVDEALSIMDGQARLKHLQLRKNFPPDPAHFRTDSVRLKQVFLNLLGNAIKFTEAGFVELKVEVLHEDELTKSLRFEVIDSGIGIPKEAKARLFQSFTQSDNSISRKYGGTGLGLSISKAIIEKMSGKIGFDSEVGQGATFWFELSLQKSAALAMAPFAKSEDIPAQQFGHLSILIIEDNPMNQFVLTNFLKQFGCEAEVASSGTEAMNVLALKKFKMIFVDVQMPGMDGFEVTRNIREIEAGTKDHSYIVATTAHAMNGYREKCLAAGMDSYLPKPIQLAELHQILQAAPRPVAPQPVVSINQKRWERLKAGPHFAEMVEIFISSTPEKMQEMQTAFVSENFESTSELAHFLKSSASSMGFDRLTDLFSRIEDSATNTEKRAVLASLISETRQEFDDIMTELKGKAKAA